MSEPLLQVRDIECRYDDTVVTRHVSFTLNSGDICCLLGPSGCGKTTLLRAIAGFEPIAAGTITLDAKPLSAPGKLIAPEKRQVGMVFQDYALFPHLSVKDNVAFGLRRLPTGKRSERVDEMLELVGLTSLANRYPHELSGGQQQRVALARALAPQPRLLLLDEPFSNLDVELRRQLSQDVRRILKQLGISAILVTHDQQEAFALADQVGILNNGQLQQWDTPYNLYHEPTTRFVASFIGQGLFLPGTMCEQDRVDTELGLIQGNRAYPYAPGMPVDVLLRPDDIVLDEHSSQAAIVEECIFAGATTLYRLRLPSRQVVEAAFGNHEFQAGEHVPIRLDPRHLILFERHGAA
ncbi:iron(III) transport system ATP-binding protein [Modicisalibacter xianhensis]|uniref:Iron(III) transport system ATP-binding protein n=1 Tax=Modicisalibacter xianhensis TaxID=442341 RepID=A0A4R8FVH9_9GAMM|nr:ABC transporter ATP-binding protein [Halomonas xianhensis]TDX30824.1 iron(III) transport system ATP-binding protein [Halomonas xianhensis]